MKKKSLMIQRTDTNVWMKFVCKQIILFPSKQKMIKSIKCEIYLKNS